MDEPLQNAEELTLDEDDKAWLASTIVAALEKDRQRRAIEAGQRGWFCWFLWIVATAMLAMDFIGWMWDRP